MAVVRLRNPQSLAIKEVAHILQDALIISDADMGEALPLIRKAIQVGHPTVLLGIDEASGFPKGVSVVHFPQSVLEKTPQVGPFYCPKTPHIREELIQATLELIQEKGYTTFRAVNEGHEDKAWARMFGKGNWNAKKVGSVMQFEVSS